MMKQIYLDYAAATPVDPRVLAAMQPFFSREFYNSSATYLAAKKVHGAVEEARSCVAQLVGARSAEIHFLPGATAANEMAIDGVMRQFPDKQLLISAVEHPSVRRLGGRYAYQDIPVMPDGIVNLKALAGMITDDTVLISVMYANNEVGAIQPLREITTLVEAVRAKRLQSGNNLPLLIHTDASQAAGFLDLHVSRLGVDLMVLNSAKVYGPKQMAVLYVRSGVMLPIHSGTDNVAGIVGCAKALQLAQDARKTESARLQKLQAVFLKLLVEKLPHARLNGPRKNRLPANLHVTFPGQDNERLIMALDEQGIMAAAGSACLASDEEPSHVLLSMGLSPAEARSSLRFTMGRGTTAADIRRTVDTLARLVT